MIVTTTPAVAIGQRVLGADLCFTDMAHVLSEVPATQSTYSRSSARPARPAPPDAGVRHHDTGHA